ncbi:hypothetical protein CAC42_4392 [Sphaceloma murrayae]|uniref:Uncharacterized protein n=1 Tax=Sphaceloma murrayae TaxID=2082308 RepID=A0A2K1QLY8_9PEZI|nr:hypothetical protein CAC42_4392 [Sphaceloma murrayae]
MVDQLRHEIDRVVKSPYPTQLQTLRHLLIEGGDLDIEAWSFSRPEQIESLVENVLVALPQWPYSCVAAVRDAFLIAEPSLLPSVIDKAIQHFDEDDKYLTVARALLSSRLPVEVPLPANAQTLLVRVSERAATKPETTSVGLLDTLLKGACRPCIGAFSPDVLRRFEANLFKVLRDASDVIEQQSLGLRCLSIMAILLSGSSTMTYGSRWSGDSMRAFFSGTKAHKTLQLVVLQVVWSCSPQSIDNLGEMLGNVQTATSVLQSIGGPICSDWCQKNTGIVRKLIEKVGVGNMSSALKLEVMAFIVQLLSANRVPDQIVSAYEAVLLEIGTVPLSLSQLRFALPATLDTCITQLSNDFFPNVVQKAIAMMSTSADHPNPIPAARMSALLDSIMSKDSNITPQQCNGMWTVNSGISSWLGKMDEGDDGCVDGLQRAMARFLLHCAIVSSRSGAVISSPTISSLMGILSQASRPRSGAGYRWTKSSFHISSLPSKQTMVMRPGATWQDSLIVLMEKKAASDYEAIVGATASVCADLEQRCLNVEQSLRAERKRFLDLEKRHAELNEAFGQVESQIVDRDLRLAKVENEKRALDCKLEAARVEQDGLMVRVEQAEARLRRAQRDAKEEIVKLQHKLQDLQVGHASQIARQEEESDALEERCQQLQIQNDRMELHVRKLQDTIDESDKQKEDLSASRAALLTEIEQRVEASTNVHRDLQASRERETELHDRVDGLQRQLQQSRQDIDRLRSRLDELKENHEREQADFLAEYRESAEHAREEWQAEKSSLQQAIRDLEQQLTTANCTYQDNLQQLEVTVSDSNRKIEKLKRECARKDDQVTEAQEMRNRLMSAMGIGQPGPSLDTVQSTLPIRSASSASMLAARMHKTPVRMPLDGTDDTDASFESEISSQQEPTPKRTKPRKSFKIPTLLPTNETSVRRSSRPARTAKYSDRQPLAETTTNRSPQRCGSPARIMFGDAPHKQAETRDPDLEVLDGWSFTTDVITSTPGVGLRPGIGDETTVDG